MIRRFKRLREKNMKVTFDQTWTIVRRSLLLAFVLSLIIWFFTLTFKLIKPVNEIISKPISPVSLHSSRSSINLW